MFSHLTFALPARNGPLDWLGNIFHTFIIEEKGSMAFKKMTVKFFWKKELTLLMTPSNYRFVLHLAFCARWLSVQWLIGMIRAGVYRPEKIPHVPPLLHTVLKKTEPWTSWLERSWIRVEGAYFLSSFPKLLVKCLASEGRLCFLPLPFSGEIISVLQLRVTGGLSFVKGYSFEEAASMCTPGWGRKAVRKSLLLSLVKLVPHSVLKE